jgi:hypothetical protein
MTTGLFGHGTALTSSLVLATENLDRTQVFFGHGQASRNHSHRCDTLVSLIKAFPKVRDESGCREACPRLQVG